jgi:hypothetical protein
LSPPENQADFWGSDQLNIASPAGACLLMPSTVVWSQNQGYVKQGLNTDFINGYAYAALSTPEGPIRRAAPLSGFILLAPGIHYPPHHHAPREVYLPMTCASWQLDSGDWFDVRPGQIIYHDSWQVHATRTLDEPFLAFVAWLDAADRNSIKWA